MKKIILLCSLFVTIFANSQQVFDKNNYGIEILSAEENGIVSVQLPNGVVWNIKSIIDPGPNTRGRILADGIIMDVPIIANTEWSQNEQRNVVSGFSFNEPGGFTAYKATAYYVEMYIGSDNKKHFNVLRAIGKWESTPNPYSWATWYNTQPQSVQKYCRQVTVEKQYPTENTRRFIIAL